MNRKVYMRTWRLKNKKATRNHYRKWRINLRRRVLLLVGEGKLECSRCGCDKYDWLQINHINNDGGKERQAINGGVKFLTIIIKGKRKNGVKDLNLLCRPCNLVYTAEKISGRKYIFVP